MNIDTALLRRRARTKHAVEQILQPVCLVDDNLCVLLEGVVDELALEQLRGTAKPAEGIADLVGETAQQGAQRCVARHTLLLAAEMPVTIHLHELHQQTHLAVALADRRHAAVHGDALRGDGQAHLALGERRTARGCPGQRRRKHRGVGQQALGARAEHLIGAHVEQLLGGGIHGEQAQIGVEQQNCGGQVVDDGLGAVHGLARNPPAGGACAEGCVGGRDGHDFHGAKSGPHLAAVSVASAPRK